MKYKSHTRRTNPDNHRIYETLSALLTVRAEAYYLELGGSTLSPLITYNTVYCALRNNYLVAKKQKKRGNGNFTNFTNCESHENLPPTPHPSPTDYW